MTKDEAIRQIENRWSIMDYGESEALGEALDIAIESLQTEQQTEEEMLREQCQAFIDIVNHTEKGESHEID